ncbi:MAG TPA: hypothetical protein VIJ79_05080 [Acidobacteriaceae bacterium]
MRPLSAVDAVSPAWHHVHRLLLARRDWRTILKIGAVAVFAEVGGCNSSFGKGGNFGAGRAPAIMAAVVAFFVLISIVAVLIGLLLFYISSRLQFVLFDVVLRSDTTVAPVWSRYGAVTWRWMLLKFLFFIAALLCLAPVVVPMVVRIVHAPGGHLANPASFIVSMIGSVLLILLFVFIIAVCYVLLRDFGLPSMALENAPMSVTVTRVLRLIQAEPGQIALYLLILLALRIVCGIVCYICLFFAALIAAIPFGGAGLALWLSLRHSDTAGHIAMIAGGILLGAVFVILVILAAIMIFGYMFTFFQAYTLYFLGGRYPLLGAYLDAQPQPQWTPPPAPAQPPAGFGPIASPPTDPALS